MSAVELKHPLSTEVEQLGYVDLKEGYIIVQPVPNDSTPAATLNRQADEGARTASRVDDLPVENARRLAATLSLEQQVRIASFVRSVELGPHCIRLQTCAR
jgi:hypothetical protein